MNKPLRHTVKITDAGALAAQTDQQAVVIIGVGRDGVVTVVSYGETRAKCASIGEWAQGLWRHAITAVPFQTVFGWGNAGRPKPLTADERATLTDAGRAYDDKHQTLVIGDRVIEAAIEAVWADVRRGGSSGMDQLDQAVAAYQLATGAAGEDGSEVAAHARAISGAANG